MIGYIAAVIVYTSWENIIFSSICFFHDLFFPSMHLSVFIILCLKETSEGSLAKDTFGGRFVTFQTGDSVYIDPNEKTPDSSIYFVFLQAYSRFHR